MQQQLEALQNQTRILNEIDKLLAARNYQEYKDKYPKLITYLSNNGYKQGTYQNLDALFDNFNFKTDPTDLRTITLNAACSNLKLDLTSHEPFFRLLQATFCKVTNQRTPQVMARDYMRHLICLQQTNIQERITSLSGQADTSQAPVVANSTLKQTCTKYGIPAAVFTGGVSLTTVSALMQFSPKFAFLVGIKIAPIMLVSVAALGALLTTFAVYRAIRTCYPAQTNATPPATTAAPEGTLVSKYLSCCFNYGGNKKPGVTVAVAPKLAADATSIIYSC